jgi:hypothetical protein
MSLYGNIGNSAMDLMDRDYNSFAYRWIKFGISGGMGSAIESGVPYNTMKYLLNGFKSYVETYITPALEDSWTKFNTPKKLKP